MTTRDASVDPLAVYRLEKDARIEAIIKTVPDHGAQLDQIAKIRGWYDPYGEANVVIKNYISSGLSLQETVSNLADPIDELYTSGDHGRAFYQNELVARNQRLHHSPEVAEEMWGLEQVFVPFDESEPQSSSTESLLWRLWFAVLHTARKTSWKDEKAQEKLLQLVKALKAHPNPPLPENITIPMTRDWIYSSDAVWSKLLVMGASFRECWNDTPGGGSGFSIREVEAHTNAEAFCARLSVDGVAEYWNYGIWALREALETRHNNILMYTGRGSEEMWLDAWLPAAAVWIHITGRQMFRWICENDQDYETRYPVDEEMPKLPWQGDGTFARARWRFWKERFGLMVTWDGLAEESKKLSEETRELMDAIEIEVEGAVGKSSG